LPGATDTKGAVAYGDATDPNEELSLVGISYPVAVGATSAREFFEQFQSSVLLSNLNVSNIELRNYGPDNAQRTALVLPEYACLVLVAANGGHPDIVNRNLDTYRNSIPQDGDDINILSGNRTILSIPGGAAPRFYNVYRSGDRTRVPADTPDSSFSRTTPADSVSILSDSVLRTLNLRYGVVAKGMGGKGASATVRLRRQKLGVRRWEYLQYLSAGGNGDLLIGFKPATASPVMWLTNAGSPPSFAYRSSRPNSVYDGQADARGWAFVVRV